jgi:hypothetical protein
MIAVKSRAHRIPMPGRRFSSYHARLLALFFYSALCIGTLIACGSSSTMEIYEHMHRQLPTFVDMMNICGDLDKLSRGPSGIPPVEARRIILRYNGGRDRWGTPLIFRQRLALTFSYILVSLGSDRKQDVETLDRYFTSPKSDIVYHSERDIVFRNGLPITVASRK